MIIKIYTAHNSYKGTPQEVVLDISAATGFGLGRVYVPTPAWQQSFEKKTQSWNVLKELYLTGLRNRYARDKALFHMLIDEDKLETLVFTCDCEAGAYCHRLIVPDIVIKLAATVEREAEYLGEKGKSVPQKDRSRKIEKLF